jgi:hypothetical protein
MPRTHTSSRANVPTEHAEQVAFVRWVRMQYPWLLFWATPNGGHRSIKTATALKAEGVLSGVPDLFFPALHFFIEMKRTKGGAVSPEQKAMIQALQDLGYSVAVCRGFDEAAAALKTQLTEIIK